MSLAILDGSDIAACRMYDGFGPAWRGFARNAYEPLGSPGALATMVVLNGAFFVLPFLGLPVALLAGGLSTTAIVWAAAAAALGLRAALAVRFGAPAWTVLATPLAVMLLIGLQCHSFFNHCTGRPVVWRGRPYPGGAPTGGG